ncbi:MAG: hypothetical protein WAU07_02555 [Microgenomates group bacterium]
MSFSIDTEIIQQLIFNINKESTNHPDLNAVTIDLPTLFRLTFAEPFEAHLLVAQETKEIGSFEATIALMTVNSVVRSMVVFGLAESAVSTKQHHPQKIATLLTSSNIEISSYFDAISQELTRSLTELDLKSQRALIERLAGHLFLVFKNMMTIGIDISFLKNTFKSFLDQFQSSATTLGKIDEDRNRASKLAQDSPNLIDVSYDPQISPPFRQSAIRLLSLAISEKPELLPEDLNHKIVSELLLDVEYPEHLLFEILTIINFLDENVLTPEYSTRVLEKLRSMSGEFSSNTACLQYANMAAQAIERLLPAEITPEISKLVVEIVLNWYRSAQRAHLDAIRTGSLPLLKDANAALLDLLEKIQPAIKNHLNDELQEGQEDLIQEPFSLNIQHLRKIGQIAGFEQDSEINRIVTSTYLPDIPSLFGILSVIIKTANRDNSIKSLLTYLQKQHGTLTEKIDDKYLWIALLERENQIWKEYIHFILQQVYDYNESEIVYDCLDAGKDFWLDQLHISNVQELKKSWWKNRQGVRLEEKVTALTKSKDWIESFQPQNAISIEVLLPQSYLDFVDYVEQTGSELLKKLQNIFVTILTNPEFSESLRNTVSQWQKSILTPDISSGDLLKILEINRDQLSLYAYVRLAFISRANANELIRAASQNLIPIDSMMHSFQYKTFQSIDADQLLSLKSILQAYFQMCLNRVNDRVLSNNDRSTIKQLGTDPKIRQLCDSFELSNLLNTILTHVN